MIKIAIVEDEEKYKNMLQIYLKKYAEKYLIDYHITFFSDGEEIVENYSCDFDVILMDILMKFMNGMSAAEKIRNRDEKVIIIFITNMTNYAIKGYQVGAFDYILKPITYFSLEKSLKRALSKIEKENIVEYINISITSGVQKLELREIYYIESDSHYLSFYTTIGMYRTYMRMKDLENALCNKNFYRIHKGIIVNLRYVEKIEDNCCGINGVLFPISRAKKKEFMERLNHYLYSH